MGRLIRFSNALVLLPTTLGMAHADDSACRFAQEGRGSFKVADRGEKWTYVLQAVRPRWEISPPDRHFGGYLSCKDCASASTGAGGQFYWDAQYHWEVPSYSYVQKRPSVTAVERSERRTEWLGYWVLHPNQLETRGIREGVKLGPLSGYAILYHPTRRRPTARPSVSSRPACASGLMPAPTTPQPIVPLSCRGGFTATIGTGLMAVSARCHPPAGSAWPGTTS
jgi:hypothetical protein